MSANARWAKRGLRDAKPTCGYCRHPGFWRLPSNRMDGRPRYQCDKCGTTWSCGLTGGEYAGHEMGDRDEQPPRAPF